MQGPVGDDRERVGRARLVAEVEEAVGEQTAGEVDDLDARLAARLDQNVLRAQVAVDDADRVDRAQRLRDLDPDLEDLNPGGARSWRITSCPRLPSSSPRT